MARYPESPEVKRHRLKQERLARRSDKQHEKELEQTIQRMDRRIERFERTMSRPWFVRSALAVLIILVLAAAAVVGIGSWLILHELLRLIDALIRFLQTSG